MLNHEIRKILEKNKLFKGTGEEYFDALDDRFFRIRRFSNGETIIQQHQISVSIHLVAEGKVQIAQAGTRKYSGMIRGLSVGEFFGEIGVLLNSTHSASVIAVTDVTTIEISSYAFEQIIDVIPVVRENVFENLVNIVFHQDKRAVADILRSNLLTETYLAIQRQKRELEKLNEILRKTNEELQEKNRTLYEMATFDPLTGVYNRAIILDKLRTEFQRVQRYHSDLSIIMYDIDNFKLINDNFGHLTGDLVLRQTTATITRSIRKVDIFGRYGGEEFLVILPNIHLEHAKIVAEKLRDRLSRTVIGTDESHISVSASFGVADNLTREPSSVDDLLANADMAMYRAKETGKNRWVGIDQLQSIESEGIVWSD